jgi:hypothetical protein
MILIALMAAAAGVACQPHRDAFYPQASAYGACPPTAVVLDFSVSTRADAERDCCTRTISYYERDVETEKDSRGWWLGRQELYFNSNVGRMAADIFSDLLKEKGMIVPTSREDLKYYYADKKDLIRKKLNLNQKELDKAILKLDPVSIGKELAVDKVIVGHICDSELRKAVAPGSFASVVSMQVAIFDVATGHIEFQKCYKKIRNHSTQYFHYKNIAAEFSQDIRYARGMGREY